MNCIYLDYASSTPCDPRVLEAMRPYFFEQSGNASSPHQQGRQARKAIEQARETLAASHRALRPAGFVLIRQLNSSLDIPSLFPSLVWHHEEGRRLQLADRSFFYPNILLASRT